MQIEERLAELGLSLPEPPKPVAAYVPCVRAGSLVVVSGQLPMVEGALTAVGKVPSQVSVEDAQAAARQCALNGLAVLKAELGGNWSALGHVVRLGVFVQSDDDFAGQPQVANGASELMQQVFGESGRHARAAVGVNSLPLNAAVEVELMFQLAE
jgi:enamine deaminase RidA (YjgF/YER057c/UK114 family)